MHHQQLNLIQCQFMEMERMILNLSEHHVCFVFSSFSKKLTAGVCRFSERRIWYCERLLEIKTSSEKLESKSTSNSGGDDTFAVQVRKFCKYGFFANFKFLCSQFLQIIKNSFFISDDMIWNQIPYQFCEKSGSPDTMKEDFERELDANGKTFL